jgi:hypothetical protein
MKKIILGLAIMAFIVAGSVNVVAQDKAPKDKQKIEIKKDKKTTKSCCSVKKACDTKKTCDTKEKKVKKKEDK